MIVWMLLALAGLGTLYQLASAVLVARFLRAATPTRGAQPPVTILKPLHGPEPRLAANLATFAAQEYGGAVQIVAGVQDPADPAAAVARALPADLVVDATVHGTNAKVSNLINIMAAARHDVLVLSDSDMSVRPDYLARVVAALHATSSPACGRGDSRASAAGEGVPEGSGLKRRDALTLPRPSGRGPLPLPQAGEGNTQIGAVTCLYHGRGNAGGWSRLAAQGISYGFLPSVVTGLALGLARPCMGSTIALHRDTLAAIGGFAAFADVLADDHAIGAAVRDLGLTVAVPGFTIAHACAETSLAALVRHELRWNATIRRLDPAGYAGAGLVNPLPFAVTVALLAPAAWPVVVAAVAARLAVVIAVDRATRSRAGPAWWLPARDFLSFGLFIGGFLVQSVDWRGSRLRVSLDGRITE